MERDGDAYGDVYGDGNTYGVTGLATFWLETLVILPEIVF